MNEEQKKLLNETISACLGVEAHSIRPQVDVHYVEPTLFQVAHDIISVENGNTIYLGPQSAAASERAYTALSSAGIAAIVNVTTRVPCSHRTKGIKYSQIAINDEAGADILIYLHGATTFLKAMLEKGSVLVHCEQGISRSASVVMAYLMRFHGMTRDEAYVHCKRRRPMVNPNPGFWDQLGQYEKELADRNKGGINDNRVRCVGQDITGYFDSTWALHSSALYSTCCEISEASAVNTDQSWLRLANLETSQQVQKVLLVCLDFLWGRGVLDADLDWLVHVCVNISIIHRPCHLLRDALQDPESEFSQNWSGEIYPEQIEKILIALRTLENK
jgi:hypothetical protein